MILPQTNSILHGSCLDRIKELPDNSIDAIVTDPPYELGFMGKSWDSTGIAFNVELWKECLRVLKPGAHLVAFSATRTYHRMACAIEDAGFEIRDMIEWCYATGFPKSMDLSKTIDRRAGAKREVVGYRKSGIGKALSGDGQWGEGSEEVPVTLPATELAKEYQGSGTALKPAHEPIVLARKPLQEKTVVDNVLKFGTGHLNIDATRIPSEPIQVNVAFTDQKQGNGWGTKKPITELGEQGRFPANILCEDKVMQAQSKFFDIDLWFENLPAEARATYPMLFCPKPSKAEKNEGLADFTSQTVSDGRKKSIENPFLLAETERKNIHPTVKPIKVMCWLISLVSKEGDTILDPFAGSGTTLVAAKRLKRSGIGIELNAEYLPIINARLSLPIKEMRQECLA